MKEAEKRIYPYSDPVQERVVYENLRTYEYVIPFNYQNIKVVRLYDQDERHGMEINPINSQWPNPVHKPADYLEIVEDDPIIRVEVIGSACTPPGYIQLSCDPLEGFYRPDEAAGCVAPRFRINNLWGMHLRADQWITPTSKVGRFESDVPYDIPPEELLPAGLYSKSDFREFPLVGFSCGIFSIPRSKTIRITGGSDTPGWVDDNFPDDNHYSFRIIRTTVCKDLR